MNLSENDPTATMLEAREKSLVSPIAAKLVDDGESSTRIPDPRTSVDQVHDESSNNIAVEVHRGERTEHGVTDFSSCTINQGIHTIHFEFAFLD